MRYIFSDESKVERSYSHWRSLVLVNRYRLKFEKTLIEVSFPVFRQYYVKRIRTPFMRFKLPAAFSLQFGRLEHGVVR